jgi:hypothetical protein
MQPLLYTGDGTSSRSITGVGFQPDLIWVKNRSNAVSHCLVDAVRGAPNQLGTDLTAAENSGGNDRTLYGGISAIGSNGFTVVTGSDPTYKATNGNTQTYVAWNWKANGAGSSNTSGTITSTVSVNATAGFSVVTYTGVGGTGTIGHGLGVAPKFIITKYRNIANGWYCYHASIGAGKAIYLNLTDGSTTDTAIWNNTSPTSSVFSVGSVNSNQSTGTYVAYCWAEIAGFSKFGSYTGNASTDGPFVYTGFRPKFVMIKCSSSAQAGNASWYIHDSSRNTSNVVNLLLYSDGAAAEITSTSMDLLSNGFKVRASGVGNNASGATYIYMAFAENPFKNANAR